MLDGQGTFWSWYRGENGQDDWAAWRGTNSGFNQSINSNTNKNVPMRIPTGPRAVVSWAQVRFYEAAAEEEGGVTTYQFLQLLGVG